MENTCIATTLTTSSMTAEITPPTSTPSTTTTTTITDHMTAAEFDEAFTAVMPRLRRRLMALTGNPHDADDLLQETYLRLSRRARASTLARQQQPYAYTCAAALNLLRDLWRHPSRQERCTDLVPERSWDGGFASREAEAVTTAMLRGLSPKEAAAVILIDLEGLTHDMAGERLGAHRGTVQRNRMRGLAKIRAGLDSYEPASATVSSTKAADGPVRPAATTRTSTTRTTRTTT